MPHFPSHSIILALVLLATPAAAAAPPIFVCQVTERYLCIGGLDACQEIPLGSWTIVDLRKRTLQRCTFERCDTYKISIRREVGSSTVLEDKSHGLWAVVGDDAGFGETLSFTNHSFVSIGNCRLEP